jgi:hypothetical protein
VFSVWYELDVYIPKDDILHSHRRENLKSYTAVVRIQIEAWMPVYVYSVLFCPV